MGRFFKLFILGLFLPGAGAMADCLEFRPDSVQPTRIIRHVAQTALPRADEVFSGTPLRHPIWIAAGDYIVVQAGAQVQPQLYITLPNQNAVLSQYVTLEEGGGAKFAEIHFSGEQAHKYGDGWVDVVTMLDLEQTGVPVTTWVFKIDRQQGADPNACDARFVQVQGGYDCDVGCSATAPAPDLSNELSEALSQAADAVDVWHPEADLPCGGCPSGTCCAYGVICNPGEPDEAGFCP